MDLLQLKNELTNDPLGLGYAALSDVATANKLNEVPASAGTGRQREREIVDAWEILGQTDLAEMRALSPGDNDLYRSVLGMGTVSLKDPNFRTIMSTLFGVGTTTRTNLLAYQIFPVSRAEFLGLGEVTVGDIERMRARLG